jgi:hypothetical protein
LISSVLQQKLTRFQLPFQIMQFAIHQKNKFCLESTFLSLSYISRKLRFEVIPRTPRLVSTAATPMQEADVNSGADRYVTIRELLHSMKMWHRVEVVLATPQKTAFFIVTAVKTSNLTYYILCSSQT